MLPAGKNTKLFRQSLSTYPATHATAIQDNRADCVLQNRLDQKLAVCLEQTGCHLNANTLE